MALTKLTFTSNEAATKLVPLDALDLGVDDKAALLRVLTHALHAKNNNNSNDEDDKGGKSSSLPDIKEEQASDPDLGKSPHRLRVLDSQNAPIDLDLDLSGLKIRLPACRHYGNDDGEGKGKGKGEDESGASEFDLVDKKYDVQCSIPATHERTVIRLAFQPEFVLGLSGQTIPLQHGHEAQLKHLEIVIADSDPVKDDAVEAISAQMKDDALTITVPKLKLKVGDVKVEEVANK